MRCTLQSSSPKPRRSRGWGELDWKCTECNFIPMSTKSQPSNPRRSRGLLGCLWVDIGSESVSRPPSSVFLFVSTPGPSCPTNLFQLHTQFQNSINSIYCTSLFWEGATVLKDIIFDKTLTSLLCILRVEPYQCNSSFWTSRAILITFRIKNVLNQCNKALLVINQTLVWTPQFALTRAWDLVKLGGVQTRKHPVYLTGLLWQHCKVKEGKG